MVFLGDPGSFVFMEVEIKLGVGSLDICKLSDANTQINIIVTNVISQIYMDSMGYLGGSLNLKRHII